MKHTTLFKTAMSFFHVAIPIAIVALAYFYVRSASPESGADASNVVAKPSDVDFEEQSLPSSGGENDSLLATGDPSSVASYGSDSEDEDLSGPIELSEQLVGESDGVSEEVGQSIETATTSPYDLYNETLEKISKTLGQ